MICNAWMSRLVLRFFLIFSTSLSFAFAAQTDDQLFPYSQGWLGGDSAYSIPLDSSSTLWLFGDTFVGKTATSHQRKSSVMIHNSIAIRGCRGHCQVTYWWSGMYTPHPKSFFKTSESDYYWPLDGFVYRGKLYIFWEQMHKAGDGGAFGFDYSSVVLATISHYLAPPNEWQISTQTVSGSQIIPGIAATLLPGLSIHDHTPATLSPDYAYVFVLFRRSAKGPFLGLMRIQLSTLSLGAASVRWDYLAAGSHWLTWNSHSSQPPDALSVLPGNITEMSIAFHPDLHKWMAVYPAPTFLSTMASYSTADTLKGPWTAARTLFSYPEMQPSDQRHTAHVFCYAAKEHPEMEAQEDLALTYACNSTKEAEIMDDMRLYRPELIIKKVEPTK